MAALSEREARKTRRREKRRAALIETTIQLIENEGPFALSAQKIAQATDLTGPALYHYFGGLEELLSEVHVHLFTAEVERVLSALPAPKTEALSGLKALRAVMTAKVDHAMSSPGAWAALYQGAAALGAEREVTERTLLPLATKSFVEVSARIDADPAFVEEGDARLIANLAFAQTQGALTMWMAARAAGTDTRFPIEAFVEVGLETLRRAWWA